MEYAVQSITKTKTSRESFEYGACFLCCQKTNEQMYSMSLKGISKVIFGYKHSSHRLRSMLVAYLPFSKYLSYGLQYWQSGQRQLFESNMQNMFKYPKHFWQRGICCCVIEDFYTEMTRCLLHRFWLEDSTAELQLPTELHSCPLFLLFIITVS